MLSSVCNELLITIFYRREGWVSKIPLAAPDFPFEGETRFWLVFPSRGDNSVRPDAHFSPPQGNADETGSKQEKRCGFGDLPDEELIMGFAVAG